MLAVEVVRMLLTFTGLNVIASARVATKSESPDGKVRAFVT
jgi:hypothetical protein